MNKKEILSRKDNFQEWLFVMDDILEEFIIDFYNQNDFNLDYSANSLLVLEKNILDTFENIEELKNEEHKYLYDVLSRYLGETIRKNVDGKWKLDIENEKSAYYKLPVLIEDSETPTPLCPHKLITACIDRRKGNFLFTIMNNLIKNKEVV